MRLNWSTTITRAESKRHITKELHRKINAKSPDFHPPGKTNTPEGQRHLQDMARRLSNNERLSPGDGYNLPWRLRYRIIRAHHPRLSNQAFQDLMRQDHPGLIRPKRDDFPPHIRAGLQYVEKLRELLQQAGINPRLHPDYLITLAYHCPGCRRLHAIEDLSDQVCPACRRPADWTNVVQTASKPDSPLADYVRHPPHMGRPLLQDQPQPSR